MGYGFGRLCFEEKIKIGLEDRVLKIGLRK
jgi:hypothetical protein